MHLYLVCFYRFLDYHIETAIPIQITFIIQVSEAQIFSLGEASVLLPALTNTSHRQSVAPSHPVCPSSLTHHSLSTCVRLASGFHLSPLEPASHGHWRKPHRQRKSNSQDKVRYAMQPFPLKM